MTQARYIYRVDFIGKDSLGADTTFRFATRGYQTSPSHATLPNTAFADRVAQPLLFRRDMYGELKTYGSTEIAHGECRLGNSDGGLDYLLDYAFDVQEFIVNRIDPADMDTETVVFRGFLEQLVLDIDQVTLRVRDLTYLLDQPFQPLKYAGTNSDGSGVEGTSATIKGQPKPVWIGDDPYQGLPILVNPEKLIYQVDEGPLLIPNEVRAYDSGVGLGWTFGTNYDSQDDMEANAPAEGTLRVWPAGGCFRLGSTPVGAVYFKGTNKASGSVLGTLKDELERFLDRFTDANPDAFPSGIGIDDRIVPADATMPADDFLGISAVVHVTEETTYIDVLRRLLSSAGASFHFYPHTNSPAQPFITFEQLSQTILDSADPADLEVAESMVKTGSLKRLVSQDETRGIPPWRINVAFANRRVLLEDDELAGGALPGAYDKPWILRTVDTTSIQTQFPASPEVTIYTTVSAAGTSLDYLRNHYRDRLSAVRDIFSVTVPLAEVENLSHAQAVTDGPVIIGPRLSMKVQLTHSRFGLSSGRMFLLLGFVLDYEADECELILWG